MAIYLCMENRRLLGLVHKFAAYMPSSQLQLYPVIASRSSLIMGEEQIP